MLRQEGFPIDCGYTTGPGEGAELARQAMQAGYTRIIAVGGDGTVNEVVNGLLLDDKVISNDVELAVLGNGTGSDFVRTYQKSFDIEALIASLRYEKTAKIDIGKASFIDAAGERQTRYFINAANLGIGAEAVSRVNARSKFFGSKITYFTGALEAVFAHKNMNASLKADGSVIRQGAMCGMMICNGRYIGGGMKVAPAADMADGLFDVVVIKDISRATLLKRFPLIYSGKHITLPEIEFYRCRKLEIQTSAQLPLETDGEIIGQNPVEFEIIPGCINLRLQ